ncbi:hypothetical protein DRQ50_07535, partial [bacterium]
MHNVLVIRFGALGDLCLLAHTLVRAGELSAGRRFTLVTKPAFAPLMARVRGVDEVVSLPSENVAGSWQLARTLRRRRWDTVIDAHAVLRAHLVLTFLGRGADARLGKDTVARLGLLAGGRRTTALERTMRHRFDDLLPAMVGATPPDVAHTPATVFDDLTPATTAGPPLLGIAPGARW